MSQGNEHLTDLHHLTEALSADRASIERSALKQIGDKVSTGIHPLSIISSSVRPPVSHSIECHSLRDSSSPLVATG